MKEASYEDEFGRRWAVLIPDGADPAQAHLGLPIGPPPVDSLGLPRDVATALHNQLFERRIFTEKQARSDVEGIIAAVRHALRLSAERVIALYGEGVILASTTGEDARQGDST